MSYRIKNRNLMVPRAYQFYQPQTKWRATSGSFESVKQQVLAHRNGNLGLCQQHNLSLDPDAVDAEVEAFNVERCLANRWHTYLIGSPDEGAGVRESPKSRPRSLRQSVAAVAAGARTVIDWIRTGEEAVPQETANHRASVCSRCPQNKAGDLTSFFTIPASAAIHKALQLRSQWRLSTSQDGTLGVCEACGCPLKLKVHCPIQFITERMDGPTMEALDPSCWIHNESQ